VARYLTGRLTELPNKHGETMAQAGPGTSAPRLQELRTAMPWDEADRNRQRAVARLPPACGHGHAGPQLLGLVGIAPTAQTERPRAPPRLIFPLARTDDGRHCWRALVRSPDGAATKPSSGGSRLIGSLNSAHNGCNGRVPVPGG
jgi:hypothetical protein